jgi:hypothetical protein
MRRAPIARWACSVPLLSMLGAGCHRSPAYPGPYGDKVATYVPMIEKALGRKFKTPPTLEVRTKDQVREFLLRHLNDSIPRRELAGQQATFKVLGLIPDTLDLQKFFVPLLTEQIIGFYDPKTKVLYVVDGAPSDYVGFTVMHELVHALQDQYVNLDSIENRIDDSDRQSAVQAVIEGQATYEQAILMTGGPGNLVASLPGGWEQIRSMIRDAQATQPVFANAPMVIQESLLFPYINGAEFIRRYESHHPGSMPLDSLPESTEQVLHEDAFFGKKRDRPIGVALPPIAGSFYQNDLGEFGTRLFLFNYLKSTNVSASAAAGWGGDRYAVVHTPKGDGIVWVIAWDTPLDAAEFTSALNGALGMRFGDSTHTLPKVVPDAAGSRRYDLGDHTVVIATREIGGRMVVAYTQVPRGSNAALLDLSRVTLH